MDPPPKLGLMLERTAASLESCSLQRVLSKPGRSSKRCRQLHTGFWQHGASAIELYNIWPPPKNGVDGEQDGSDQASRPSQTGLLASAFLFDFLYPSGTYALLRRLYPTLPRPQDGGKSAGAPRRRNFTSHAVTTEIDTSVTPFRYGENADRKRERVRRYASRSDQNSLRDQRDTSIPVDSASASAHQPISTANEFSRPTNKSTFQALTDLLTRPEEALYHDVWDLYCKLNETQEQNLQALVAVYLSTSHSIVDIGRAISLFRQTPAYLWDDDLQTAGVLLNLRAGDRTAAIDVFHRGLQARASGAGLEHLLEDTILKRQWPMLLKIWLEYHSTLIGMTGSSPRRNIVDLPSMTSIPDLATLYFAFERYLETESLGAVRAINLYADTRLGLEAIRHWLAVQVLRQPCPPNEAKAILQIWSDPALYQSYLSRMLERWDEGYETRAGLSPLSDIYSNYRKLDSSKTPVSLLRKMFNFYYPADTAGLAEVYCDWHQTWGDLDQWGYEKYLKFYSTAGDVQAVKDLWARYTNKFPAVVKQPMGFRSTLNAYAQVGDIAGAEKEFQIMTVQHGVKPDIDSWNTLLKCYSKSNDQARIIQCFEEIRKVDQPNSFTYAQVMAMAAKKGERATVLKYFDQSQKEGVPISKEMALSLVMVYCHNDRLADAEKICVEFAERNVTSTAVWNQLIYFNGVRGKLNKCYALLKSMKSYGMEWDHQTHEFLLRAMVQVDQIQSAYRLLQNARSDRLFPVGPEHFAVVMSGAVRTGHLGLAETILSHMRSAGHEIPFKAHVSLVEAAVRRDPSAERTRALARDLVEHMLAMLPPMHAQQPNTSSSNSLPKWTAPSGLVELRKQTKDIGRAIVLLVELRDFAAIEQIVTAYKAAVPEYKQRNCFPPEIAAALMLGHLKDSELDRVHKIWKQTIADVLARGASSSRSIVPAYQYDLARPLNVVIKAFKEASDGQGLLNTVEQVTSSGFKLTSTNWNLAIRYLAELGHWERAMAWCEQTLMPRWRGWTPAAKSLQERRDMKNTRVLTASKATVFSLQREWLKLRKLAAWSGEVSSRLKDMEQRHPMLHYAFTTTDYEHLPPAWVLPKKKSMNKAIKEMLKPLSHDELSVMRKALEKQLRLEKKRSRLRKAGYCSPFHVVAGRAATKKKQGQDMIEALKGKGGIKESRCDAEKGTCLFGRERM
ncbi:hypothetical protein QQS21_011501 [Conoideocrella luteorostrata]|uniref:Pentacotripeptide-repeat region of PRORP domain-containing protein n=1 Tax=Conoideocrella luteorostrata TaxID=1105319 RepID=A0AAJ0CD48_9HYPO|nr:hypothetical protein QQS21_011501 [Conoideocrella luteorostrata]